MAYIRQVLNPMVYLPMGVRLFIRRRMIETTGIAMIGLCLIGLLALASWQASDPSFNNATSNPPQNWAG